MILHDHPLLSVDVVVNELLAEEIQLKCNSRFDKRIFSTPPTVFAAPFNKNMS